MWLDHGSIQESLDLHLSSADAVGFIPVDLGNSYATSLHTHVSNTFELSPSPRAKLTPESHDVVDVATDGNHLDVRYLPDDFKVHDLHHPGEQPANLPLHSIVLMQEI
jgi:hypothetical protein